MLLPDGGVVRLEREYVPPYARHLVRAGARLPAVRDERGRPRIDFARAATEAA